MSHVSEMRTLKGLYWHSWKLSLSHIKQGWGAFVLEGICPLWHLSEGTFPGGGRLSYLLCGYSGRRPPVIVERLQNVNWSVRRLGQWLIDVVAKLNGSVHYEWSLKLASVVTLSSHARILSLLTPIAGLRAPPTPLLIADADS